MPDTPAALLREGARRLSAGGIAAAEVDARALLKHRMHIGDAALAARDDEIVGDSIRREFARDIARRLSGEPAAYIVGRREFMGIDFITTPAALAPRPETEELTETALAHILPGRAARALDLGAGCGVIGLSIARLRPQSRVTLADCSEDALSLARRNAAQLNAPARFCRSDWFQHIGEEFDLIVANPPYIAADDSALSALHFEPRLALCGGEDGLRALSAVIAGAPQKLRAGGLLFVEHGATQEEEVRRMFAAAGFCGICCRRDLARRPRITFAVRPRR
ncbi:MAG: peptide chain release factor N(5)-glutamine methyltransferase [Gammaproteobacteria bacterium]